MRKSEHYDLRLPERDDQYNIDDFDDNFTAIDIAMNDIDGRLVSTSNELADLKEKDRNQHDESTEGIRSNRAEINALKAAFENYKYAMEKTIEGLSVKLKQAQEDIACPIPVKGVYVQFPRQNSPEELWPTATWELLDYDGAFFRAQGGNAATFLDKSDVLTKQNEQLPNVSGNLSNINAGAGSGVFKMGTSDRAQHTGSQDLRYPTLSMSLSYGSDVYVDNGEVRPANYTCRIWKRTA